MTQRFLLFFTLCAAVLLSGCEGRPDELPPLEGEFKLLRPAEGGLVESLDDQLRVGYLGAANHHDEDNLRLLLNGIDLAAYPLAYSDANGLVRGGFSVLGDALLLGENTLLAINTDTGYSKTMTFYFDNQKPRAEITAVSGGSGANGEPQNGDLITVEGRLADPSDIAAVTFRTATETVALVEQPGPPPLSGNSFTNVPDANGDKTFRLQLTYPDISGISSGHHFQYSIRDVNDQSNSESFLASGAVLNSSLALQLNDSLTKKIKPVSDPFIKNLVDFLEFQDVLPGLLTPAISAYAPSFCGPVVDAPFCAGAVEGINIVNPRITTGGYKRDGAVMKLGIGMQDIYVSIRIDGYDNCTSYPTENPAADCTGNRGNFRTTIRISDFEFYSYFRLKPGAAGDKVIDIERTPVKLYLNPGWHGLNKQALLANSRCSNSSICAIDPGLLEFGYNFRLTADGRELAGDILVAIADGVEGAVSAPLSSGKTIDDLLAESLPTSPQVLSIINTSTDPLDTRINRLIESDLLVSHVISQPAHPINDEPRNSFLRFMGGFKVDAGEYDPDYQAANGGIGSLYRPQNGYQRVNEGYYPSKLPGAQGPQIDLAFALSANTLNQYLLAEHQAGNWEEKTLELFDVDLSPLGTIDEDTLGTPPGNDVKLKLDSGAVPRVEFTGYKAAKNNFNFEIIGVPIPGQDTIGVGTDNEDVPGTMRFLLPGMTVAVLDLADDSPVMDVTADISIHISLDLVNGVPVVKPFDDFVTVYVRELAMAPAYDGDQNPATAGKALDAMLTGYLTDKLDAFNGQKGQVLSAATDLFGSFSGVELCLPDIEDTPPCSGSNTLVTADQLLADVLTDDSNRPNPLPLEYGLVFRSFGIEPSGAFFTFMADVQSGPAAPSGNTCPNKTVDEYVPTKPDYFRAWCIEQ